ncbi:hypothetical protein DENSPDRAFT_838127 [Dentipellis sp. KUC8613]|nr:hypothetical protein DENSPDRAFT_838127 [Dentipellis sp. KUC8613]
MDWGHKNYWDTLKGERGDIETLLWDTETRAQELKIQDELEAADEWIQEQEAMRDNPKSSNRNRTSKAAGRQVNQSRKGSLAGVPDTDADAALDAGLQMKRMEVQERIRLHLARWAAMPGSRFWGERWDVIFAYVRRVIYIKPWLMPLADSYESVLALLYDDNLDLMPLDCLWEGIRELSLMMVFAAVDDVMRPPEDRDAPGVVMLGGKVYKSFSGVPLPFHAWGHIMAIHPCYSCIIRRCITIEDVIEFTRFLLLTGTPLVEVTAAYGSRCMRLLALAGMIPRAIQMQGPRYSVTKTNLGQGLRLWEETKINPIMRASVGSEDSINVNFVRECWKHPDLLALAQDSEHDCGNQEMPLSYTRRSDTRRGLARIPWEKADCKVLERSIFEERRVMLSEDESIDYCGQVIVVDDGEGGVEEFEDKLLGVLKTVYEVEDVREIVSRISEVYVAAGELEVREPAAESTKEQDDKHVNSTLSEEAQEADRGPLGRDASKLFSGHDAAQVRQWSLDELLGKKGPSTQEVTEKQPQSCVKDPSDEDASALAEWSLEDIAEHPDRVFLPAANKDIVEAYRDLWRRDPPKAFTTGKDDFEIHGNFKFTRHL